MFDKWLKLPAHLYLRIIALLLIAIGLTLSNVLMSIGAIWLLSNWILEGDFRQKWARIRTDKALWLVLFLFFFGLFSVLWSDNKDYWFQDARVKLPFFVIPFVLATSTQLRSVHFRVVLYVFIGVAAFTTLFNYISFHTSGIEHNEIRMMSKFISHLRLSTAVVLAIFSCAYLILERKGSRYVLSMLVLWFLFYTYSAEVMTGYVLIIILSIASMMFVVKRIVSLKLKIVAATGLIGLLSFALIVVWMAFSSFQGREEIVMSELETATENGNEYFHDTSIHQFESGKYIWVNVCQKELENEWNKRSSIRYDSLDNKGQPMFGTLMRYLTSKEMNKDSASVWQLTDHDVKNIENGMTNADPPWGLEAAVHSFLFQYQTYREGGDPNGHSLLQRIEHLRIAKCILEKNWLLGVGTGDVQFAFEGCYVEMNSKLLGENQHRAHNEFITVWISHGIIGFFAFAALLILPLFKRGTNDYFALIVVVALVVSCLTEDMLETQAGVTLLSFFLALSLYRDRGVQDEA